MMVAWYCGDKYGHKTYEKRKCECQDNGYGIDLHTGKCEKCGKQLITEKQVENRRKRLKEQIIAHR